ncbi:hemolysin III family protein [Acidothermaceae bacterium B102]|nr:hemolysin III family protein [Acidothermaceae bacterium B102]
MTAGFEQASRTAAQAYIDMLAARPKLRGLLHGIAFPLTVVAGIVLVSLAGTDRARLGCAIYALSACLLFGVSALYHRWHGSQRVRALLRRLDHANIFLIIAGTYSPIALTVLHGQTSAVVLTVVWAGALLGIGLQLTWTSAPRWLYVPIYLALGWVAVFVIPDLLHHGGVAVLVLVAVGGTLYSLGAVVYAFKRPDPVPRVFGYHEVFHALTVAAFILQYVAVSIAVYSAA